jgi:hypothetical protein
MTIRTTHLPFLAILLSNFLYAENKPEPGVIATVTDGRHTVAYVTPAPHFTLKSNESLHPQIGANFQATFEGALTISEPDSYTIQADAKVTINGKVEPFNASRSLRGRLFTPAQVIRLKRLPKSNWDANSLMT